MKDLGVSKMVFLTISPLAPIWKHWPTASPNNCSLIYTTWWKGSQSCCLFPG